jgi:glycosyltransferase involved in cell wall biosynthesis
MLSREDPYPLVMLNAAAFSTLTVCFEGSGGPPEFVGNDAGVTVPYGDILAMARVLNELGEDAERRKSLGEGARLKLNRDHDMASTMRRIIQEINSLS